jgi:hypothetical protein
MDKNSIMNGNFIVKIAVEFGGARLQSQHLGG